MTFKYWGLYLTNLSGFLSYMGQGTMLAYSSAVFPNITFGKENEPLTPSMTSWLASFLGLFAIPGPILVIPLMDNYGRKLVMRIIPVVMSAGWLLAVCSYDVATLAVSRALLGLSSGMNLGCAFVYISEISPKQQRGVIAAFPAAFVSLGAILVSLLGNFFHWRWTTLVCLGVSLVNNVASVFVYETPRWLISKGQSEAAVEIMKKLWLIDEEELKTQVSDIEDNLKLTSSSTYWQTLIHIFKPPLWKPLVITQLLIALQQLIGTAYISTYTVQIFDETGLTSSAGLIHFDNPYYQSALVWLFFLIGTAVTVLVIDRFGRRVLLIFGTGFSILSLVAMGIFAYLENSHPRGDLRDLHWIPVTSLLVFNFCSGAGIITIPYLMLSEMFPIQTRVVASSLGMVTRNLLYFLVAKVFLTSRVLPIFGIFWLFAGFGVLGIAFVIGFVPETKGRSLEEIQMQWYK